MTQNADRGYSRARANPVPVYPQPVGSITTDEVERVWLNAASIKWTYTPYTAGVAGGLDRERLGFADQRRSLDLFFADQVYK